MSLIIKRGNPMQLAAVIHVLGGEKVLRKKITSRMDFVELSSKGLTKEALMNLAKFLRLTTSRMAEFLPVTPRTIQRYRPKQHFNQAVSEQILMIAEVAARGTEVFQDRDKFLVWMSQPSRALGNRKPETLLKSKFGVELVLDELGRIQHGVFA
jgi:putative toxin-antitoxin system antitoxin component (TIGR02293 family)